MLNIRRNVFETNSSSMHSLAYSKKDRGYDYNLPTDKDGIVKIKFGEYGWGPKVLTTPIKKLTYWCTDNIYGGTDGNFDEVVNDFINEPRVANLFNKIKELNPEVKGFKFMPNNSCYTAFGYVDHQSCGTSNEVDPIELIFNKGIFIVIDNDNYEYYRIFDESLKPGKNTYKSIWDGSKETVYNITEKDFDEN